MKPDPVVDEVRAIRDAMASEHGYDIDAIFEALRRLEESSERPAIPLIARESFDFYESTLSKETAEQGSVAEDAARRR
ncbi:hypothetical protein WME91_08560 [Sorangium sp. So ce269]